jgi:Tfp pilus assembly protein PilO
MKVENRQKFLLIVTAAVVGLWLGDMLVFEPLGHWWTARSQAIKNLRDEVKHGKSLLLNEASIRDQWGEMRTNTLPNNISLAEQQMFKSLDNWAQESGASLTGIMPQWKNDSTNYLTLNCRVEASGTIATLGSFLYKIEKGPLGMKLDSVELSAHDTAGQQLTLGLQISGLALTSSNIK